MGGSIYDLSTFEPGRENVPEYDRHTSDCLTFDNGEEFLFRRIGKGEIVPGGNIPFRIFCVVVKLDLGKLLVQGYKFRAFLP